MNTYKDELWLCHHGVKGQKWGVRRYQNVDGSLTSEGKKRYSSGNIRSLEKQAKSEDKQVAKEARKELKKINKERDYIDQQYALSKLYDAARMYEQRKPVGFVSPPISVAGSRKRYASQDLQRRLARRPFTLNPVTDYRNKKTIWTEFANKKVGDIKTPTGRTVQWVEKEYYWRPIKVFNENNSRSGSFYDYLTQEKNNTLTKPKFIEQKKKG